MATITFYGFAKPTANVPSASGYCQKLETHLRAAGFTAYTPVTTLPFRAPKGKLPYIELHQPDASSSSATETIADSHFILQRLVATGVLPDPDAALTPAQRADSRAWAAWTEDHVYPALVLTRWQRPANYAVSATMLRQAVPWPPLALPLAWYMRRRVLAAMDGHGVGRHSDAEVDTLLREYVEALDARLGEKDWMHEVGPTGVDSTLGGFLLNAVGERGTNPEYFNMLLKSERIVRYLERITRRWFPEYEDVLEVLAEGRKGAGIE